MKLFDTRERDGKPLITCMGHNKEVNSLNFNPFNEYLILTGSSDQTVALWDMRNLSKKLHSFTTHNGEVLKVEWSPHSEFIFGSCADDRKVIIWDLSQIGDKQTVEESRDGPPEVLFVHGGHRAVVPDFNWNRKDPNVVASVEEDNNTLQIWQMRKETYVKKLKSKADIIQTPRSDMGEQNASKKKGRNNNILNQISNS